MCLPNKSINLNKNKVVQTKIIVSCFTAILSVDMNWGFYQILKKNFFHTVHDTTPILNKFREINLLGMLGKNCKGRIPFRTGTIFHYSRHMIVHFLPSRHSFLTFYGFFLFISLTGMNLIINTNSKRSSAAKLKKIKWIKKFRNSEVPPEQNTQGEIETL